MTFKVAQLDEIPEADDGRSPFRPVRHHLDIEAFGVNTWTAREAGDRLINEHDEADDGQQELYVVLSGRARFEIDGEPVDAPTGTFVSVQPGTKRTAFAEEAGTTLVVVGGTPGKAYEVFGWELWAPVRPAYEAGDYEAAVEGLRKVLESEPKYGLVYYNAACVESLTGRTEDALEHLRQAFERTNADRLRELAKTDSDLDAIRDEPAFKELVGTT